MPKGSLSFLSADFEGAHDWKAEQMGSETTRDEWEN